MASLEEQFEAACAAGDIPGVVLAASDREGKFQYQRAFGPKSSTEKIDTNATFVYASCTKLMTSIAALQCVERGQIGLDDDLSTVLNEFKDIEIITGLKEDTGKPIFKKAENKITLRHLLTHTSGFGMVAWHPLLNGWRKFRGEGEKWRNMPLIEGAQIPLLFEPGTGWMYGASTDWAGILVMRLNNMSLEAYMQKYIWDPVGAKNITFHLELKPDVRKNLVTMAKRGEKGTFYAELATTDPEPETADSKLHWTDEKLFPDPVVDEYGRGGGIGSAVDFTKILHSICADDGRLLKSETIDDMFSNQLGEGPQEQFTGFSRYLKGFGSHPPDRKLGHGLAGLLLLGDSDAGLKSGTLSWNGLPNLLWTIDRKTGLCLMYASNVIPFGDMKSHKMQQLFEKEMYSRFANQ